MDCEKCRNKALKTAAEVKGNHHNAYLFIFLHCRMNKTRGFGFSKLFSLNILLFFQIPTIKSHVLQVKIIFIFEKEIDI